MDVIMPQLGETVAEGKIATWFKAVGDAVKAGENLFEIETDKVSMEVQATVSGVLSEIRVAAGETVPVGTVVAVLGGEAAAGRKAEGGRRNTEHGTRPDPSSVLRSPSSGNGADAAPPPRALRPFEEVRTPVADYGKAAAPLGLKITPLARRLVKEAGLDLAALAAAAGASPRPM